MKALQHSNQKKSGSPKINREPPNESSAVEWKSGSSPGEGQYRPTLPPPRQLQVDLPPCNNNRNGTTIGMKPKNSPKTRSLFGRFLHPIFVFNPSIYHFILNISSSLPENIFAIFPQKALLRQGTAEWKKE